MGLTQVHSVATYAPSHRSRGLVILLAGLALALAGCGGGVSQPVTPGATITEPPPVATSNPSILSPASVPSAVGVCSEPITIAPDGHVFPLVCGSSSSNSTGVDDNFPVNSKAWQQLLPMNGGMFALGPNPPRGPWVRPYAGTPAVTSRLPPVSFTSPMPTMAGATRI